ncbi:MAG TPA: hypothetical protein VGM24_02515 [Puia sp.]|jgi:hypothetical protein
MALTTSQKIHYTLRVGTALCFIGHGSFGIITKAVWCNYFAVFGIGTRLAYQLMPWLGSFDILLGLIMLILPLRIIPAWLFIWGLITAACRPLSGEPVAEFFERAGNFGVPFTLLVLSGGLTKANLFSTIDPDLPADDKTLRRVFLFLKVIVFMVLTGHGILNLMDKKSLLDQYGSLGFSNPAKVALTVGLFEITAAVSVLIRPVRSLVLLFFVWKMGTELFYPHYEFFEWVERGGSYSALLALWFAIGANRLTRTAKDINSMEEGRPGSIFPGLIARTSYIVRSAFSTALHSAIHRTRSASGVKW